MSKRQSQHLIILIIAALGLCSFYFLFVLEGDDTDFFGRAIEKRRNFLADYADIDSFLMAYETNSFSYSIENTLNESIKYLPEHLVYSGSRIQRELTSAQPESSAQKAERIYEFVRTKRTHTVPLYSNNYLHHPPHFFSVYGSGFCDDAAWNTVALAGEFGFPARTRWLNMEHVIAEIFYDNKWRVFDPDLWGVFRTSENEIGDYAYLETLSLSGGVPKINDVVRAGKGIKIRTKSKPLPKEHREPFLSFFPKERQLFFPNAFFLSTDGLYLEKHFANPKEFLQHYSSTANFVREVVLDAKQLDSGQFSIEDYFPIVAAFIQVEKGSHANVKAYATSSFLNSGQWINASEISSEKLQHDYLDLSAAINNFERIPSFTLNISDLEALLRSNEQLKLITVHMYASANFNPNEQAEKLLSSRGLKLLHH